MDMRCLAVTAVLVLGALWPTKLTGAPEYAVVVSRQTQANESWRPVVDALRQKHSASVLVFPSNVADVLPQLRQQSPRFTCFVAQPEEATREFVARVHRLTRELDTDPYTDTFWGILTGYDATNALRIAQWKEPFTVRKVASGTEIALEKCEEGVWYCELNKGKFVRKQKGERPVAGEGVADSTEALVRSLTEFQVDCFVTSGHATERDWQIGYRYRNGSFRCEQGLLYGLDTQGRKHPIQSSNPKVYLPIGNCLMGHVDSREAMALAFLNSAGVKQMIGYTVPSWYGYAGWGCLDYFLEQPGRYTFTEAFFANQAALIHRLQTYFPEAVAAEVDSGGRAKTPPAVTDQARQAGLNASDARGLLYDRDTVAFYGDPAWEARLAPNGLAWEQKLTETGGTWTLEIVPNLGAATFEPVNRNGSQRGGRPIIQFLPRRIKEAKIIEGADLRPVVTDNFVLVPNPRVCDPTRRYRVVFQAGSAE